VECSPYFSLEQSACGNEEGLRPFFFPRFETRGYSRLRLPAQLLVRESQCSCACAVVSGGFLLRQNLPPSRAPGAPSISRRASQNLRYIWTNVILSLIPSEQRFTLELS
jgi:hypothetical protein